MKNKIYLKIKCLKKIKAIKCPQCGSTKQKAIDEERFQCLNCGTEYIIDYDDININHNYNYNNSPINPINKRLLVGIILVLIVIPILFTLISSIFSKAPDVVKNITNTASYTWEHQTKTVPFIDAKGDFKMLIVGPIYYPSGEGRDKNTLDELYWAVYDIKLGKLDQFSKFNDIKENGSISSTAIELKKFDDGSIYFIYNKNKIFEYDIKKQSLTQINDMLLGKIPELKSGIGVLEFSTYYDFLKITSNTGKRIQYFPSTQLKFTNDNYESKTFSKDFTNNDVKTKFIASYSNPSYIIKYQSVEKTGYPIYKSPNFTISFNNNEDPEKAIISDNDKEKSFIKKYEILNPTSVIYKLKILGYTNKHVYVAFKNSIQEGEKFNIQMLDYNGKIIWNYKSESEYISDDEAIVSEEKGVFCKLTSSYLWINNDGKTEKAFKLDDIKFHLKN